MRTPHVQGAFRQRIVCDASQAHKLADHVSDGEGSMAEPLSVALHAVNRAGPLLGKSVLVTGCGPIGALVVIAARRAGATHIVATDMAAQPLRAALKVGADQAINVAEQPEALAAFTAEKGQFDALFEASGNQRAGRRLRCAAAARHHRAAGWRDELADQYHQAKELTCAAPSASRRICRGGGTAEQAAGGYETANRPRYLTAMPARPALAADRSLAMKVLLSCD
jgi:L-idonate 5-dehydrogenase